MFHRRDTHPGQYKQFATLDVLNILYEYTTALREIKDSQFSADEQERFVEQFYCNNSNNLQLVPRILPKDVTVRMTNKTNIGTEQIEGDFTDLPDWFIVSDYNFTYLYRNNIKNLQRYPQLGHTINKGLIIPQYNPNADAIDMKPLSAPQQSRQNTVAQKQPQTGASNMNPLQLAILNYMKNGQSEGQGKMRQGESRQDGENIVTDLKPVDTKDQNISSVKPATQENFIANTQKAVRKNTTNATPEEIEMARQKLFGGKHSYSKNNVSLQPVAQTANTRQQNNNNILTITPDEYTDEFRRVHKASLGLSQKTVSSFHRQARTFTEDEQRRLGDICRRLLSRSSDTRYGQWINLIDSKSGNKFNIAQVNGQLFHDVFQTIRQYLPNGAINVAVSKTGFRSRQRKVKDICISKAAGSRRP